MKASLGNHYTGYHKIEFEVVDSSLGWNKTFSLIQVLVLDHLDMPDSTLLKIALR